MKVIVGIENRISGEAIIDFIARQTWESGTSFKMIHAIDQEPSGDIVIDICCERASERPEREKRASQDMMLQLDLKLIKSVPDVMTEEQVIVGRAKDVLIDEVIKSKADLLIVGSHGRTGFQRFLLGSVSTAVLSHAPCSVLIVRPPHSAKPSESKQRSETTAVPAEPGENPISL